MKINDIFSEKIKIHWIVPVVMVGIASIMGIIIPKMIISTDPVSQYKTFLFIWLLIISALAVSTVRYIKDTTLKSLLYLIIGFTTFWIVGASYHGSYLHLIMVQPENTEYYKLFNTDFIPVILFAIANAITVLVALIDGRKNGMIFGSMGLGVIIFSITSSGLEFVGSKIDILLLLIILWAIIPVSWIRFLSSSIDDSMLTLEKRFFSVLKGALITVLTYIIICLLTYYTLSGSAAALESFSLTMFISNYQAQLSYLALSIGYFYILPNVILILSTFLIYDFSLHAFNLKKQIREDGTIIYLAKEIKTESVIGTDYDPFEDIIKEMKEFKKDFSRNKINRLVSAQKIGTFKEQIDFLNSKYDIGSKEDAVKILKQIEKETEFTFK
ncbi:MAG TPA: hypothetical protein VMW53_11800 [archaeon]|nr:hypothetical protein [archaeon]